MPTLLLACAIVVASATVAVAAAGVRSEGVEVDATCVIKELSVAEEDTAAEPMAPAKPDDANAEVEAWVVADIEVEEGVEASVDVG